MAEQMIGSTRIFVLAKGFTRVGSYAALIGEDDTRRLFAEVYARSRPFRSAATGGLSGHPFLDAAGWTLRLLQLFWPDPAPRLGFQRQVNTWRMSSSEGLDILRQGLLLAVQELPLPFARRTILEFALSAEEGKAWWDGFGRIVHGFWAAGRVSRSGCHRRLDALGAQPCLGLSASVR